MKTDLASIKSLDINVRDDFRRDGIAASFLVDKELYEIYVDAYPSGTRFNIGYPSICSEEYKACERILQISKEKKNIELCLVGHAREFDIALMANLLKERKNVSANIWIPSSTEAAKNILGLEIDQSLRLAKNAIRFWKNECNHPLDIALTDVTNFEKEIDQRIVDWYFELKSLGYRSIILCDTKGIGREPQLRNIFQKINDFEWHPHNDSQNALLTCVISAEYNVKFIGTSYLGYSERMNMLDPRQLVGNRMNLEQLKKFHEEFQKSIGDPIDIRNEIYNTDTAITGTHFKLWNSSPNKKVLFGVTSDCRLASIIAGRIISSKELSVLKNEQLYKKKILYLNKKQLQEIVVAGLVQ